ncbi:hypothetical protein [Tropicimonas sp. S265A]|uniref:hypothetical protein n=1 Tax=Tropicimonas sp. S265A TaxID=3415134 RepID=UPI003C7C3070
MSTGTFVEDLICNDPVIFELDQRVQTRFEDALLAAEGLETGAEKAVLALRDEQELFLMLRAGCLNTMNPRGCVFGRYERREAYLVARWTLEEPVARTRWECDGADIDAFSTVAFETRARSIRFEDGDTVSIGFRRLSSKGQWYVGERGRSIVIRGERATYTRPFPKQTEYVCRVAQTN